MENFLQTTSFCAPNKDPCRKKYVFLNGTLKNREKHKNLITIEARFGKSLFLRKKSSRLKRKQLVINLASRLEFGEMIHHRKVNMAASGADNMLQHRKLLFYTFLLFLYVSKRIYFRMQQKLF